MVYDITISSRILPVSQFQLLLVSVVTQSICYFSHATCKCEEIELVVKWPHSMFLMASVQKHNVLNTIFLTTTIPGLMHMCRHWEKSPNIFFNMPGFGSFGKCFLNDIQYIFMKDLFHIERIVTTYQLGPGRALDSHSPTDRASTLPHELPQWSLNMDGMVTAMQKPMFIFLRPKMSPLTQNCF